MEPIAACRNLSVYTKYRRECAGVNLPKHDLVIQAWAKHDLTAAATVKALTKKRLDFIRVIYSDVGFEGDELEMRAMLFVRYHTIARLHEGLLRPPLRPS